MILTSTHQKPIEMFHHHHHHQTPRSYCLLLVGLVAAAITLSLGASPQQQDQPLNRPWLRAAASQQRTSSRASPHAGVGAAVEVAAPANLPLTQSNRSTRTADIFSEGYNIVVTNTCERESMKVNIKTSIPFHGVIHTKNQRQRPGCSIEGNGGKDYNLEISHILNSADPTYCGVIKARRDSPDDKDILSVVVAVRPHKKIELPDDKFFLLNCTNRCRKSDCSSPAAKLVADPNDTSDRLTEEENGEREGASPPSSQGGTNSTSPEDECTIWRFPWAITLLWCMGILLLAMIISHCIMCSSMVCRCVKTEVEETEPSIYEGASDYEDDARYNKRHPYRIEYDNRDIYKTANNYEPYNLEEEQSKAKERQKNRREKSSR